MVHDASKAIKILLVEDSESDAELIRRGLRKVPCVLHHTHDGVEAMEYLRSGTDRPDLILLDLNMPRMDGKSVLRELNDDESLKTIPVITLTTSNHQRDIQESYGLNTNAYIVKPTDATDFFDVVQKVHNFWTDVAELPT